LIVLETSNIKLRALEPEDLDFLFQTENNTSLWEVSNTTIPFSRYILTQYLANAHQDIFEAKQLRLIIQHQQKPIGMIDLFNFEPQHHKAGIGIVILQEYQQKGFANEALNIFIKYAFNTLQLHQLYANITTDNLKSIQLFTKNNFKLVGIKKDWIFIDHQYKDEGLYQLINPSI
jgi:diamine N-acetyltransferase